jgi:hypothetical protein
MRRLLSWIGFVSVVLLVAMQFARPRRVHRKIDESQTILAQTRMPPEVATILDRSCNDCHSERTAWRWYSNIAPVSWLQMADVGMGRDAMNLSRWSNFTPRLQKDRLQHICKLMRSGDMPLWYYKPLHPSAWVSSDDANRVCGWTQSEIQRLDQASPKP